MESTSAYSSCSESRRPHRSTQILLFEGTCGSGLQPGHVTNWQVTTCSALLRVGAEAPTHMFQHCRIPVRHCSSHLCITMWSATPSHTILSVRLAPSDSCGGRSPTGPRDAGYSSRTRLNQSEVFSTRSLMFCSSIVSRTTSPGRPNGFTRCPLIFSRTPAAFPSTRKNLPDALND